MKYALIIPDGAADEPLEELGGQTPLQAAQIPNIDWISTHGRIGTVNTVPLGYTPGSDVAILSLVGYDPDEFYCGRAPLEAAAQNLQVGPDDIVFRCNLTTIADQVMVDFASGHISQKEAEALIADLNSELGTDRITFFPGVMYRHLMVIKDAAGLQADCTPPHDIIDQPIAKHLPRGKDSKLLTDLMKRSQEILGNHPINETRRELGEAPASSIWLWGHGPMPQMPTFHSRFSIRGACITAVDLVRGISTLIGWPLLEVAGATGYVDTNFQGKGQRAVQALDDFDLVVVHIEAPDEAGHNGNADEKIQTIMQIDELVVGPVLKKLKTFPDWKILLLPDHPTPVSIRTHTATPPPFCIAGSGVTSLRQLTFCETNAENCDLHIDPGHELMEFFLKP